MKKPNLRRIAETSTILLFLFFCLAIAAISCKIAEIEGTRMSWNIAIKSFDLFFDFVFVQNGQYIHAFIACILGVLVILWRNDSEEERAVER